MRTTGNKIIVKQIVGQQSKEDALLINPYPTEPLKGRVICVGARAEKEGYKDGMALLYHRFNNDVFEWKGETFTVITPQEVLRIL